MGLFHLSENVFVSCDRLEPSGFLNHKSSWRKKSIVCVRRVMIILEVTVLGTAAEVGSKIGNPTPLRSATEKSAAQDTSSS